MTAVVRAGKRVPGEHPEYVWGAGPVGAKVH